MLNKEKFQKGTLPKWSKGLHMVVFENAHSYMLDNGRQYKYYEMQLVNQSEDLNKEVQGPTREVLRRENTVKRRFKQSGVSDTEILTGKRQIKPVIPYILSLKG